MGMVSKLTILDMMVLYICFYHSLSCITLYYVLELGQLLHVFNEVLCDHAEG